MKKFVGSGADLFVVMRDGVAYEEQIAGSLMNTAEFLLVTVLPPGVWPRRRNDSGVG